MNAVDRWGWPAIALVEERAGGEATSGEESSRRRAVRGAVVSALSAALGTAEEESNPLRGCVRPDGMVVIKPNLVYHAHPAGASGIRAIVTDPVIVTTLTELALDAVGPNGGVVICDTPLQSADWNALVDRSGLSKELSRLGDRASSVAMRDLRTSRLAPGGSRGAVRRSALSGDPCGYAEFSLLEDSRLHALAQSGARFGVGDYDPVLTESAHDIESGHRFRLSRTVLDADLVISVPKLKTHCKAGLTGALKNFIGVCGEKSFLPHYRRGGPGGGGDEFATNSRLKTAQRYFVNRLSRKHPHLYRGVRAVGRPVLAFGAWARGENRLAFRSLSGSWPGNDTLWRTILDVYTLVLYGDVSTGGLRRIRRRVLHVMDAVVAGQGHGPLLCAPYPCGAVLAGWDAVAIDLLGALILGIDPLRLPVLTAALAPSAYRLTSLEPPIEKALSEAKDRLSGRMRSSTLGRACLPEGWEALSLAWASR